MIRSILKCAAICALALQPITAQAAKVSPMIVELEPIGRDTVARIELTNDGARDIPYEVLMMRGIISEDGELGMQPADDQFLVFPAQAVVEGNSQQVFRVQYVGDPDLPQSETFYMSIRQVPVDFEGGSSQVQVVVNYNVLMNVVPDGTSPAATVSEVEAATDDGQAGLRLRVGNDGTRYFMAGLSEWTITGVQQDGTPYERSFRRGELSAAIGVGVVGPGKFRRFFVPTTAALDPETVQVEISP